MTKKRGRKKGVKLKPETMEKILAARQKTKETLGIQARKRLEEPIAVEDNDTFGSPGRRIMPKFGTADKR